MDAKKITFIESLKRNLGHITKAAQEVGVSRQWYYTSIKNDPHFREECLNVEEYILDVAENCLINQIVEGNTTAIIFYLKTKGRKRGYIEGQELRIDGVFNVTLNLNNHGGDQLQAASTNGLSIENH